MVKGHLPFPTYPSKMEEQSLKRIGFQPLYNSDKVLIVQLYNENWNTNTAVEMDDISH